MSNNSYSRLVIIDGNALVHRAFHALPPLNDSSGLLVNAVYGFTAVLIRVIKEFKPSYMACCFDMASPTFRHIEYKEYKAKRIKAPQELYDQIPLVKEILTAFKIPIYEKAGFEADDLIGTLASKSFGLDKNLEVVIVTGDLDTLQLINGRIKVWALKKGIKDIVLNDEKEVFARFGLKPEQLADYRGLKGDPSDNIPGVPGIGEKTAKDLIQKFGSLENLYEVISDSSKLDQFKGFSERIVNVLKDNKDQAFFSKHLSLIQNDVDLEFKLSDMTFSLGDLNSLKAVFDKFAFRSLWNRLANNGSLF